MNAGVNLEASSADMVNVTKFVGLGDALDHSGK